VAVGLGLGVEGGSTGHADWVGCLVKDLQAHAGAALVVVGDSQPPAVHALGHAINEKLGAFGTTVTFTAPVEARGEDQRASFRELTTDMAKGRVNLLVVIGGNPVYDAPADVAFVEALTAGSAHPSRPLRGRDCRARRYWHIPETHPLEAWSDVRAADGTVSIVQPLIAPPHGGTSAHELLAAFTARPDEKGYVRCANTGRPSWARGRFREALGPGAARRSSPALRSLRRRWR
jgi:molybdopterin-containing oxidoreductase family iron-sulfur binding subunit